MAIPENEGTVEELLQDTKSASKAQRILQWQFFRKGHKKVNKAHWAAFCNACQATGVGFNEDSSCGGYQKAMDDHLKGGEHVSKAVRDKAL